MEPQILTADAFQLASGPLLDVRAPAEFAEGHLPGARNLPLFDDREREELGICYRNQGQQAAFGLGLQLAGKKVGQLLDAIPSSDPPPRLYCWRGGMRSQSMGWLLQQFGRPCQILAGGYKAYRRSVRTEFSRPRSLWVISGMTGAGKTRLLARLREAGEQVIDLEQLAHHRGSAFGAIGQPPQPTTQQFENRLAAELAVLDPSRRTWLEDESRAIGRIRIPEELWAQMRIAPVLFVDVPRPTRAQILTADYGPLSPRRLAEAIAQIRKRLGGDRMQAALTALDEGRLVEVADILLDYYDRGYHRAASRRTLPNVLTIPLQSPTQPDAISLLVDAAEHHADRQPGTMASILARLRPIPETP